MNATLDYTGLFEYSLSLKTSTSINVSNITLIVPVNPSVATFQMGFGQSAAYRPSTPLSWKWDGFNGNNNLWLGHVYAGLRLKLKGPEDQWAIPSKLFSRFLSF